ncbi:hypothetical protein Bca101_078335 [Brassica carinata]
METLDSGRWSDLPADILRSLFERPKGGSSPLLLLSPEEGGCRLYNPEEDRVYVPRRDFSGCRFLGNSGKWFLVADSQSNLYIVDVFSDEKIDLPRLELVSCEGCVHSLEPLGDGDFNEALVGNSAGIRKSAENLRGVVWVDEETRDYVVVCRFDRCDFIRFCKKGDDRYNLSGKDGFEDVIEQPMFTWYKPFPSAEEEERMRAFKVISESYNIAVVTRSGAVLLVHNYTYESTTTFEKHRMFGVYKRQLKDLDPETYKPCLVEVDSLGDDRHCF